MLERVVAGVGKRAKRGFQLVLRLPVALAAASGVARGSVPAKGELQIAKARAKRLAERNRRLRRLKEETSQQLRQADRRIEYLLGRVREMNQRLKEAHRDYVFTSPFSFTR